ncbi:MAG: DUF6716 putative glycosyltransferase [Actinomycetes bacterium]
MRQVLMVAAFDSQLKWCSRIAAEFARRGFGTRVVAPGGRSALSPAQIRDVGLSEVERVSWPQLVDAALASDVVVCGLAGPLTRDLSFTLSDRLRYRRAPQPVVISGWVGVIIEKLVAGYLDRCGSDIVAVNGVADLELFTDAAERLAVPADNLLLTGLPFLSADPRPPRPGPIRRVLFADQPTVPSSARERLYLYRQLLGYARAHPDREVLLKPRHRPGEDTFHRMLHHPEDLLGGEPRPANFRIDYTPIPEALPQVDLLLTVSSTACLEALDAGCRVGLVLDLGVHERYGNHVFLDSGLLRTFRELAGDQIGTSDPGWFRGYFFPRARSSVELLVDRAEDLLATGERPSRAVWDCAYFTSAADAHRALSPEVSGGRAGGSRYGSAALRRRQRRHGPVRGTLAHLSSVLVPPILHPPLRSAARHAHVL